MKKHIFLVIFLCFSVFGHCHVCDSICCYQEDHYYFCNNGEYSTARIVYICTGDYAYAYHSSPECPGLSNCKGQIIAVTEYDAVYKYGRKPCCRCWTNTGNNCVDDYRASGGSGGEVNSEAIALVAVAAVLAGLFILSNDMYVYPSLNMQGILSSDVEKVGMGWDFGLRKTFRRCAIEYGGSFCFVHMANMQNYYYYYYDYNPKYWYWGAKVSFVHDLFYYKIPDNLHLYIGPSVNYTNHKFGFGGLVGFSWEFVNRLKLDVRYELTTQTNQLMLGLIFKYQKKYLWQR